MPLQLLSVVGCAEKLTLKLRSSNYYYVLQRRRETCEFLVNKNLHIADKFWKNLAVVDATTEVIDCNQDFMP